MSVCDGATIRKERLLDMLAYCNRFMPQGTTPSAVFLYMSMNHGLTDRTTQKYLNEMQLGGIITISMGRILMKRSNYVRMLEIVAPTRDPTTGQALIGDMETALNGGVDEEEPEFNNPEGLEPKKKKKKPDHGVV